MNWRVKMKLSEAIKELEAAMEKHGDIILVDEYCATLTPCESLEIDSDDNGKTVALFTQ
jgi:hypothetical protein